MAFSRSEILKNLRTKIAAGIPIIGAGAGTGISAKSEERGGADIIIIYNTGEHRMHGRFSGAGSLPLGDANGVVVRLASYVLPVVEHTPVIAGVLAHDPYRNMRDFLKEIKELGFSGVQNFPTFGSHDGYWGTEFRNAGFSFEAEAEMIAMAHELDLLTTPYVFGPESAVQMTKAGADLLVCHVGGTVGGAVGVNPETSRTLDECVQYCQDIHDAAVAVNPDVMIICHGGRMSTPTEVEYVLQHTNGIAGFYGASSCERLPVETAITDAVKEFKSLRIS